MYQLRGGCRCPGDMVVRIRTVLPGYNAELVLRGVLQCFLCVVYQHTQPETWCSGGGGGGGLHLSEAGLSLRTLLAESLLSFLDKSGTTYRGKIEATLPAG